MQGTLAVSLLFLGACLAVFLCIPVTEPAEEKSSEFNSYTSFFTDFSDESELAAFKTDYADDYSPEDDNGLALYRQPQSRPAVEWFYTHLTGSRRVATAILENADKNDIPLSLAFSLAYVESHFKPNAVNKNTNSTIDRGLFQLNSASFPRLDEEDFFDPETSAKYGMTHLRYCMDIAGNEITGLAMYNAGAARVKKNQTPQHTLNYVAKISNYRGYVENQFNSDVVRFYSGNDASALAMAKNAGGKQTVK